jgi:hypothetical protein
MSENIMFKKNNFSQQALMVSATTLLVASLSSLSYAEVLSPVEAVDIQEPAGTYNTAAPNLLNMTATTVISPGPCVTGHYAGCTLNDVLNDIDSHDAFKPEIKVHFTADDYPDDGLVSNAKMRQRGNESRSAPQKSFRIKLDKNLPLWRGERKIQLMKSAFDPSRIRNKLCYDLFSEIPHLPSMRTQFVHLTINDQGIDNDYGLYTQIENFGKEYLKRRGWDKDSRVYKVEDSGLYDGEPGLALDATGKPVDLVAFEKLYEIKRGKTHFDLINMLRDLNDPSIDFNTQIMGKYFNRDNYLTWFAVNLLVNNQDSHFHNYYLYNPKGKDDFYLIPWDYDSVLGMVPDTPEITYERLPRWWFSHANFWEIQLHNRFLSEPGNLQLLADAVTEVKNKYFTPAKIAAKRDAYYDIVFPIIRNTADWNFIGLQGNTDPERVASYNQIFSKLSRQVDIQYARFMERLHDPMTFKMNKAVISSNYSTDHNIDFSWRESVSLTGQTITYDLDVATDKLFKAGSIVEHITGISGLTHTLHWTHPKGTYFYRVIARDAAAPQQHWQESLNAPLTYDNGWLELHGVESIIIPDDGDIGSPDGSISNPASGIAIDGNASDWNGLTAFATDPDDIGGGARNVIDWQNAIMAHDNQKVYLLYRNRGPVDPNRNSGSYSSWGWQAFFDTDNNPATGFRLNNAFGADYLVEANQLQHYTGSGNDWNWQSTATASSRFSGNIQELSFNRSELGNPQSLHIIFQGANAAYGGNTTDVYPNSGFLSYSFGNVPPPTNRAPVASNQSQSVVVNTRTSISLNATDADGDALTMSIVQQPAHGTLAGTGLTVQYTPDQNYTGTDKFRYRVNDGTANSNIATVSINVVGDNPGTVISNPVVNGGITVNGNRSDWNALRLFANDPDDIPAGQRIDWLRAGLAHSNDRVYVLYENRGKINPSYPSGNRLDWGWQTFFDTDNNPNTGFPLNAQMGADFMIEGRHVYRHNGGAWNWVDIGKATTRYNNNVAELSFPRSWFTAHSTIKVSFIGENVAFGGNTTDYYPNRGSVEYYFGNGSFGRATPVAHNQRGLSYSPQSHQPSHQPNSAPGNPGNAGTGSAGGGGSFSWLLFIPSLWLIRRRYLG